MCGRVRGLVCITRRRELANGCHSLSPIFQRIMTGDRQKLGVYQSLEDFVDKCTKIYLMFNQLIFLYIFL